MSWIKENWLDVLIFILLAAVVVAIVLFLTGINPFARRPEVVAPPAVTTPAPKHEVEQPSPAPAASNPETSGEGEPITVLPLPPASGNGAEKNAPKPAPAASAPPPSPAAPSPAPRGGAAPGAGRFRVAVGSFTRPSYAAELAKKLEARGYPVRVEVVGKVSRVVVGPYASKAKAEAAAKALASYEPLIYRGDTPAPTGRYLQVAAFKTLDRAAELAKKLKAEGYDVAIYYRDGWAKVWVGPLNEAALDHVKKKLEAEGFEPVEVKGG